MIELLNSVLLSDEYWISTKAKLVEKFQFGLSKDEQLEDFNLRAAVLSNVVEFLTKIQQITGIKIKQSTVHVTF